MDNKRRPTAPTPTNRRLTKPQNSQPKRIPPKTSATTSSAPKRPFNNYSKSSSFCKSRNQKDTNRFVDYSMTSEELGSCELPVDGQLRRRLTDDCTAILHDENGPDARKKYLAARSVATPREKYFYPEATSYRYGWVTEEDVNKLNVK